MKAQELRIGNFIRWEDDSNEIIQVESIEKGKEETKDMYFVNGGWIEDFIPVPLTQEWLLKFGFEKEEAEAIGIAVWDEFYIGDFQVSNHGVGLTPYHLIAYQGRVINIYYVHELQNLYFCITREELPVLESSKFN